VELDELKAMAFFWRGQLGEARATAERAATALTSGVPAWHQAAALAITAAGQSGDQASVIRLARLVAAQRGDDERLVALGRAVSQLAVAGALPDDLRAAFVADADHARGPDARAWVARGRAAAAPFAFDGLLDAYAIAHRAHREAGDERAAAQIAIYLTSVAVWSGAFERAREAATDALRIARRLAADYLQVWGRYAEAKLLVETAPLDEATEALDEVIARTASSPRMQAGAWIWRAIGALKHGVPDDALHAAEAALATHASPAVAVPASAAAVLARLRLGHHDAARELHGRVVAHTDPLIEFAELKALAEIEGAMHLEDAVVAASIVATARARIEARALTIADALRRNDYRLRPWAMAALHADATSTRP
jgi:hypothetical protein